MIPISCILIFIVVAYIFLKTRNLMHPTILFYGLWMCCLACAGLGLYRMRSFSNRGVALILVGLVGFGVGVLAATAIKQYNFRVVPYEGYWRKPAKLNISQRLLNVFLAAAYVGVMILVFYVIKNLRHGVSYSYIRNMYYGYGQAKRLIPSTFINTFLNWVSVPCLYALIPVAMMNFFEKNGNKKYAVLVFIAVALYIFGSAGRFMLMFICVQGFGMLSFYGMKISKKMKRRAIIVILGVLAVLMIITKIRARGSTGKKVNSIYAYLSIPVYLLDYWIDHNGQERLHGGAFIYGILTFLNYFTSKIGFDIPLYRQAYNVIQVTQDRWVSVFPGEFYNAYVSMFYYFYIDFGVVGVLLGCALFGYICYMLYYNAFVKKEKASLLFYMLMIQCIVCSLVRWQIGTITMVIAFLVEYMITLNKVKIKIPVLKIKSIRVKF